MPHILNFLFKAKPAFGSMSGLWQFKDVKDGVIICKGEPLGWTFLDPQAVQWPLAPDPTDYLVRAQSHALGTGLWTARGGVAVRGRRTPRSPVIRRNPAGPP